MSVITLAHRTGVYTLTQNHVNNMFSVAYQARVEKTDLDRKLISQGWEERLLDCIKKDEPWLYKNLKSIAKGKTKKPRAKVPPDWSPFIESYWNKI